MRDAHHLTGPLTPTQGDPTNGDDELATCPITQGTLLRVLVCEGISAADVYLDALARHHSGRLATLDRGLATLHPQTALLIPS